ncbi:MAG TPA: SPOR domain-containing protein, partial [Arenimonas sp.]|nr:SPOR domain-containing protein [Arenimonas sp.]
LARTCMDTAVKQRLIGAAVLAALAMIFLPMLLRSPDVEESDASRVPLDMPAAPDAGFETRVLPLPAPAAPAAEPVTGAPSEAVADPNAVVTVEVDSSKPAEVMPDSPTAAADAPPVAVDAATGQPVTPGPTSAAAQPTTAAPSPAEPAEPAEPAATAVATPTAPPAPRTAAPSPAAVAAGGFAVNVGSFAHLDNARALEAKLRAAGLPVLAERIELSGKPALRLRVGPYAERAIAEAARLRAQALAGGSATVIALDAGRGPPPRPTAASVGFAVQLGALRVEADAVALRDRARTAGFVAFHQRVDSESGPLWRVRVGPEADRAAADKLRDAIAARLGINGMVVSHP